MIRIVLHIFIFTMCMSGIAGKAYAQATPSPTIVPERRDFDHDSLAKTLIPPSQRRRLPDQFFRHDQLPERVTSGDILSLSVIRKEVMDKHRGRVVDVRLLVPKREGLNYLYDVKVLTKSGKLLSIIVDAKNAQILDVKG